MSTLAKALEDPLQTAGVIILITGAGGAFGGMIRLAGVGETIEALARSYDISLIPAGLGRDGGHSDRAGLGHGGDDHRGGLDGSDSR